MSIALSSNCQTSAKPAKATTGPSFSYFSKCCWLIAFTSFLDAGFAVYYKCSIQFDEQNPICLALIQMEPDWMSVFIAGKFLGTSMVILTIVLLFRFRQSMGHAVATALSIFQIGLITYQLVA